MQSKYVDESLYNYYTNKTLDTTMMFWVSTFPVCLWE